MEKLKKVVHFIPVKSKFLGSNVTQVFIADVVKLHGVPKKIVSNRDVKFTSKFWNSHSHPFSCRIAQWRQASSGGDLNLWLIQIWASLCVAGGDSTEYLWGVLYYVLLHVLNQYNIQIVWGFQLYAFPVIYSVDMCDWCFNVRMRLFLNTANWWSIVEEAMYYACIPQIVYNQDNLYE